MNLQLDYNFIHADREKGEATRKEVSPALREMPEMLKCAT
jgi:hypothetical protein